MAVASSPAPTTRSSALTRAGPGGWVLPRPARNELVAAARCAALGGADGAAGDGATVAPSIAFDAAEGGAGSVSALSSAGLPSPAGDGSSSPPSAMRSGRAASAAGFVDSELDALPSGFSGVDDQRIRLVAMR